MSATIIREIKSDVMKITPEGMLAIEFGPLALCGSANPGISISHTDYHGERHCGVLVKEDCIAIISFLEERLKYLNTTR